MFSVMNIHDVYFWHVSHKFPFSTLCVVCTDISYGSVQMVVCKKVRQDNYMKWYLKKKIIDLDLAALKWAAHFRV
jgi:hypothetical protein